MHASPHFVEAFLHFLWGHYTPGDSRVLCCCDRRSRQRTSQRRSLVRDVAGLDQLLVIWCWLREDSQLVTIFPSRPT